MNAYLPRHAERSIRSALASVPIVIIDGPRAAGKTTTAKRFAKTAVMLPRDLPLIEADAAGYLTSLAGPVLIDEWQLAGVELLWVLKQLVDERPSAGRFILTGSVEPATYGPTYPLTGRSAHVLLRPMTRAELAGRGAEPTFLERHLSADGAAQPHPERFEVSWLGQTGFPAGRVMDDPSLLLEAYAATVAQRAGEEGRDATRLSRTMRVLATLEGQSLPEQRVWEAADINKVTWKAYDDLLQRVHLSVPLQALESNRLRRLTSFPKRFLADTALALTLADVDVDVLRADPRLAGQYLESLVVQQLRPQADLLGGRLHHVRTGAGQHEVDVVAEVGDRLIGLEVKLTARPGAGDAQQLAWFRDAWPERFHSGLVVHSGADTYSLGDRLWAVPVSAVAG